MIFATFLLLCSFPQIGPQTGTTEKPLSESQAIIAENSDSHSSLSSDSAVVTAAAKDTLPATPEPKIKTDSDVAAEPAAAQPAFQPESPLRASTRHSYETPTQRKLWYALAIAGHSGAAFDAWSTRRVISGGYGTEQNPMLRPFAHSGALYAATQVSPLVMDFLGKRMMTSQNHMLRKMWWLPQAAGAGFSFAAGAHNMGVAH